MADTKRKDEDVAQYLPTDSDDALLVGRVWDPVANGPCVAVVKGDALFDITSKDTPTVSALLETDDPAGFVQASDGRPLGNVETIMNNSFEATRQQDQPFLLAPCDLQAVKASGVTFVVSLLERVIEERAKGDQADPAQDLVLVPAFVLLNLIVIQAEELSDSLVPWLEQQLKEQRGFDFTLPDEVGNL